MWRKVSGTLRYREEGKKDERQGRKAQKEGASRGITS